MSRVERLLKAIIQNGSYDEERLSRVEDILYSFLKDNEYTEDPMSRMEALLITLKNSGMYSDDILSRVEAILKAKIDGTEYPYEPESRVEELLLIWDVISEYEVYVTGVPPLTLNNSVGKPLVNWSIVGNTEQASGTYTGTEKEVTAVGVEDGTEYPYFNTDDFANVAVGDEVNFSGSGLSYSMEAKKIENSNIYFENLEVDGNANGSTPLVLENSSGKDLKSWSITGNIFNDSPSPDVPVAVKGVGERTENLFPLNAKRYEYAIDGVQRIVDYSGGCMYFINVKTNTNYTVALNSLNDETFIKSGTTNNPNLGTIVENFEDGYQKYGFTVNPSRSFNSGNNHYLVFYVSAAFAEVHPDVNINKLIMLNEGTAALPYEPYGYRIPVVTRGKNLFDKDLIRTGWYTSSTKEFLLNDSLGRFVTIPVKPNTTYCLTRKYFGSSTERNSVIFTTDYPEQRTGYNRILNRANTDEVVVFTTSDSDRYASVMFARGADDEETTQFAENIQLEIGSTATKYEPYIEPITTNLYLNSPLMPGEILNSSGTREIKWGKMVLTGDESWIHPSNSTLFYITNLPIDYNKRLNNPESNYYSTHFAPASASTSSAGMKEGEIRFYNGIVNVQEMYIKILGIDTVDAFKAWLRQQNANGTPVIVYYQLANPLTESFDVPEIHTVKGNCVVDTDTEVKPTDMSINYTKSIDFTKPVNRSYSISYPSPTHISEVKGVGEKAINLFDVSKIKNATPVEFNGRQCLRGSDGSSSPTLSGVFKENTVYSLTTKTYRNEGVTRSIKVAFYYTDGTRTEAEMYKPNDFRTTITSEKGKTVKDIQFVYLYNMTFYIDLEETTLNEGLPIPLEKFGSYRIPITATSLISSIVANIYLDTPLMADEVLDSTGKRDVKLGKYEFTGNERYDTYYGDTSGEWTYTYYDKIKRGTSTDLMSFYSHFKSAQVSASEMPVGTAKVGDLNNKPAFLFKRPKGEKQSSFEDYLRSQYNSGTPVIVYYPLATPTSESFDVPEIQTVKGNCVVDTDTEVKPTNIDVTYISSRK